MFDWLKILIRTDNFFSLALNTGDASYAIDWVEGKSAGAFTPSCEVASCHQQMGPRAIWPCELARSENTPRSEAYSDNSPDQEDPCYSLCQKLLSSLAIWQALIYWPKPRFTGPNNRYNTTSKKFPHASRAGGRALFTGPIGN